MEKPSELTALVCEELEVNPEDLVGPRKLTYIVEARWVTVHFMHTRLGMNACEIADRLQKDQGAIYTAIKRCQEAEQYHPSLLKKLQQVERRLSA